MDFTFLRDSVKVQKAAYNIVYVKTGKIDGANSKKRFDILSLVKAKAVLWADADIVDMIV